MVGETYRSEPSPFVQRIVLEDKRLKYIYIAIKLRVGAVVQVDFLEGHVAVILTGVGSDRLEVQRY